MAGFVKYSMIVGAEIDGVVVFVSGKVMLTLSGNTKTPAMAIVGANINRYNAEGRRPTWDKEGFAECS